MNSNTVNGNTENFSTSVSAGDFVFSSGQAALGDAGNFVPGPCAAQMRRSIEKVQTALAPMA